MVQTLGTRWVWQPPAPPCYYGSRVLGPALSHAGQRNPPGPSFSSPVHCAPRTTAIFFSHLQKMSRFILASTSQEHFRRNPSRSFTRMGMPSRPWSILPKWRPALEAGVGLVEAVATRLPMKLSPSLSIPGVGPSAVSAGRLTPDHRAALSPAHSCSLTSPHHDPEWPEAPLQSGTPEREGKGLIVQKRLIWTSPLTHPQLPVHHGQKEHRHVPPAGRRPPIDRLNSL